MSRNRNPVPSWRSAKSARGNILAETLLAILVATLLTTALVSMFAQVKRAGNAMQAELIASACAQEVVDQLRALPFSFIAANAGSHTIQVSGTGSTDALFPRPLLRDTQQFDYSANNDAYVTKGNSNMLHTVNVDTKVRDETAKVVITVIPAGVSVQVTIAYVDGTGHIKRHVLNTILSQNGITG